MSSTPTTTNPRDLTFISYHKADHLWLERLEVHLKPLLRPTARAAWSDTYVTPGDDWDAATEHALSRACVMVLLVSADYLISTELDRMLRAARVHMVTLLWLPVRPSAYEQTELAETAPLLEPARTLALLTKEEAELALVQVCRRIAEAVNIGSTSGEFKSAALTFPNHPLVPSSIAAPGAAYDASTYIQRLDEEQLALDKLACRGAAVVLQAPERLGKTWLLERVLESVRARGPVVQIDLKEFAHSPALGRLSDFLRQLAAQFLDQSGVARSDSREAKSLLASAFGRPDGTPSANLRLLMERHILPAVPKDRWLIVALDSADVLFGSAVQEGFFMMLRTWMGYTTRPAWSPLRLLMTLSTAPHLHISELEHSPFNVADTIRLPDFTVEQLALLCRKYALRWSRHDCQNFRNNIGGHPFLVHHGLYEAHRKHLGVAEVVRQRATLFAAFLDQCVRRLNGELELSAQLRQALLTPGAPLPLDDAMRLVDAGFLIKEDSGYRPRQPLFTLLSDRLR